MSTLNDFMESKKDGLFYIGHSSALIRMSGKLILFDPVWGDYKPYGNYWNFYPEQINCDTILDQVSSVIISHIHGDHLCMPILKRIPLKCEISIMGGRKNLIEALLPSGRLIEDYYPFQWHEGQNGTKAYFVRHPFNSVDSSVFLSNGNFTCYLGSDNFLDEVTIEKVKPFIDPLRVDIAMVPREFIHWWPFLMKNLSEDKKKAEINRMVSQSFRQYELFEKEFKPRYQFAGGSNLFYCAGLDHILNWHINPPSTHSFKTGDSFFQDGHITDISINSDEFPPFHEVDFPPMEFNGDVMPWQIDDLKSKIAKAPLILNHEIIVNQVVIDLGTHDVFIRHEEGQKPFTRFNVNRLEFERWLREEISFEELIGTRRFECIRIPDVYRLEVFEFMNNFL